MFTSSFPIPMITLPNMGIPTSGNMQGGLRLFLARLGIIMFLVVHINLGIVQC